MAQVVKNPPAMQEIGIQSLGQEDPLHQGMELTPVFLPRESHEQKSDGLQSMVLQRVGHN